MTQITGTTKDFKQMFEMIMCGSKYPLFQNVILEIDENISVNSMDQTRAVGMHQEYKNFEIEGSADIPIDTVAIYEAIKFFDLNTSIKLIHEDNKIILKSNSEHKKDKITIPTLKLDEISNKSQIEFTNNSIIINDNEMKFDAHVMIDVLHIKDQIRKGNYVNNLNPEYVIIINGNKLTLIVGNPDDYETSTSTEITVEDGSGNCQSTYAHGYNDIFKSLDGNVMIYINNSKPMMISQITDKYTVQFLIAPTIKE